MLHELRTCNYFCFQKLGELVRLREGLDFRSDLARQIGKKGYHEAEFDEGPYPVAGF